MKTSLLLILILTCSVVGAAQSQSKCFRADWLQGERIVNFTLDGHKVSGTFAVGSNDDPDTRIYPFSGTRRGSVLTITFAENKRPDVSPSELKSLIWRLVRKGRRELLRINVYGKNYNTNKYTESFAYFEPCTAATRQVGHR